VRRDRRFSLGVTSPAGEIATTLRAVPRWASSSAIHPPHRVAGDVRGRQAERIELPLDGVAPGRNRARHIYRQRGRLAEAGQVDSDHIVPMCERGQHGSSAA
jgi:hypothetical protein